MTTEQWVAKVAKLEEMMMTGVLESEHDGARLKYRSMSELMQAIEYGKTKITASSGTGRVYFTNTGRK